MFVVILEVSHLLLLPEVACCYQYQDNDHHICVMHEIFNDSLLHEVYVTLLIAGKDVVVV
jgi:hypothetical protein